MASPATNANGHRRRELRRRVFAEESHCALCGGWVDKSLRGVPGKHGGRCLGQGCSGCSPDPMSAVVDEDLPRVRGGSPYSRENCHLMHRKCNAAKGTMTIGEYMAREAQKTPARVVVNLVDW